MLPPGTILPIDLESGGRVAQGFCTPNDDTHPQIFLIPPKRVLPIIFIPGIMGSNLRVSAARQQQLGNKNNVAWAPDRGKRPAVPPRKRP